MINYLQVFFLLTIFMFVHGTDQQCQCLSLKSEDDCLKFPLQYCEWTSKKCDLSNQTKSNPLIEGKPYCSQYESSKHCLAAFVCINESKTIGQCNDEYLPHYPCIWVDTKCQFFTGCSMYIEQMHQKCNEKSKECTTDSVQCIQRAECHEYLTVDACKQKNIHGQQCTWDPQMGCKRISRCSELQIKSTITHENCYDELDRCTINKDNDCVDLLPECSDYTFVGQCKITSSKVKCKWQEEMCRDMTCDDAPLTLVSENCYDFLQKGMCEAKYGGGCQQVIYCSNLKTQVECQGKIDTSGTPCFWIASLHQCVIYKCENAPLDYQNDKQCQSFQEDCIANEGSGCKLNTSCSSIKTQIDCNTQKSGDGKDCMWEDSCIEKACENASTKLTTHQQCEQFLFSCTTDNGFGCQTKNCKNAPDTLKTNEDCEKYLPDNHCITRSGGGCIENGSCSKVTTSIACVKDINGSDCYWYEITGTCITKQCDKAPSTIRTQEDCEKFWSKCQVNQTATGCEDKICENYQNEVNCTKQLDFYGRTCQWRNKCIEKTCLSASTEIKTHEGCNAYLSTCTLALSGKGCMSLPLQCEQIKLEEGCYLRQSIGFNNVIKTKECAWKNGKCLDKSCYTAPINKTTTVACKEYMQGCYVNNDKRGCWVLPECSQRALQEICEIENNYKCAWDEGRQKCQIRACDSTLFISEKAKYQTAQSCNQYPLEDCTNPDGLGCCTLSNTGLGCMRKPDSCTKLKSQGNCIQNGIMDPKAKCLWTGDQCVIQSCSAIKLQIDSLIYNHTNCFEKSYQTCTVNDDANACMDLQQNCSQYSPNDQCKIDSNKNECVIRFNANTQEYRCDIKKCGDVVSKMYNSYAACNAYDSTCTVIARVNQNGCIDKQQYCFNYKFPEQCFKNLSGQKCIWNNERCWDFDKVDCSRLVLTEYSTQTCEDVVSYCKVNEKNTGCKLKTCEDYTTQTEKTGGPVVSQLSHCQAIISNKVECSINNALNACVIEKARCNQYTPQECYYAKFDGFCLTNGSQCYMQYQSCTTWSSENDAECKKNREFCKYPLNGIGLMACASRNCEEKDGVDLTENICKQFDQTCTVSRDKKKCILIQNSCGTYKEENTCLKSQESNCIWQVGATSQCIGIASIIEADKNCSYKKGTGLTYQDCQDFSRFCSVNRAGTQCVAKKQCGGYTIFDCQQSDFNEYCIQSKVDDAEAVCKASQGVSCEQFYLGESIVYTSEKCSQINKACTNLGTSGCTLKTCQNAIGPFTHETCSAWKDNCTVNAEKNGCQEMKDRCYENDVDSCIRTILDGVCIIDKKQNQCLKKTCYSSDDTLTSDAQCEQYMSTCTVAQSGGCILRSSCDSYLTELQCVEDNQGAICFWNPSLQKCVLFECKSIERTEKYDSHDECYELINVQDPKKKNLRVNCTVNYVVDPNDQSVSYPSGCMNLQACNEYLHKEQCKVDTQGQFCRWNTDNPENEFCEMTSCQSADPDKYYTHKACTEYQLNVFTQYQDKCTVAVVEISPGTLKPSGCRNRAECEEYKIEDQCRYSSLGQECKWDRIEQACFTLQCNKAPQTFTTHERCNDFAPKCTLRTTMQGCMDMTPNCEDYQINSQCTKSMYGSLCYWNGIQCVTRLCSNTPDNLNGECSKYLSTCESSRNLRCVTTDCEKYTYVTDAACKQVGLSGKCTTDGTRCVLRTTCEEARAQEACKVNNLEQQCIWNAPTTTRDAYCETSICELASKTDYVSEKQCRKYNNGCTLRQQGGCKLILNCTSYELESSCTFSRDGKICVWEKDVGCRSNDCSDLTGTDHFKCKKQNKTCTISKTGNCVNMAANCTEYQIEESCVETFDGLPCLWVKPLRNENHPQGLCIKYLKCEDIPLKTDAECKSVFKNCTSNGTTCISITKCENLSSINCNRGSDGECMLIRKDANSASKICKKFNKCKDIQYQTHAECYEVNQGCTTSGSECMELKENCQDYLDQSSCYITKQQTIKTSKSTDICVWEGKCRNQSCSDISGTTHKYCNSKLNSCTSDGTTCMSMQECKLYKTKTKCTNGYTKINTDINPCYWEDANQESGELCRDKNCNDILPVSNLYCSEVTTCVYDATQQKCIIKNYSCSQYNDQNACNQGASNQKICYWANSKCLEVTGCQVITEQAKCLSLRGCSYITQNGTSSCVPQDCQSIYQQTNSCKFIQIFNSDQTNTCMIQNGQCNLVDPSNLMQDTCLINSNYKYTWSTDNSKCVLCYEKSAPPNNTTCNKDSSPSDITCNGTDDSAQKISIVLILLSMMAG
ncbi:unnamed protein product [Paramecium octaurelia]|uniref:Uncharacterized protein n=1 Tax=Paramecium octaurelia TaxID=43137 RepID=A0A8S1YA98_PAROT|nr:unnamed protein product [Paramecium octaurelia]